MVGIVVDSVSRDVSVDVRSSVVGIVSRDVSVDVRSSVVVRRDTTVVLFRTVVSIVVDRDGVERPEEWGAPTRR